MIIIEDQLSKIDIGSLIHSKQSKLYKLEKTKNILIKDLLNLKNYTQDKVFRAKNHNTESMIFVLSRAQSHVDQINERLAI